MKLLVKPPSIRELAARSLPSSLGLNLPALQGRRVHQEPTSPRRRTLQIAIAAHHRQRLYLLMVMTRFLLNSTRK